MIFNKKANTAIIAIFFGTLIVFTGAFVYFTFTTTIQHIHDKVEPGIDEENQATFMKVKSAWNKWPLILFFMVILMMIVWVTKSRAPGSSQY